MIAFFRRFSFSFIPLFVLFGIGEFTLRFTGWPEVTSAFEHNEPYWVVDPNLRNEKMPHKEENSHFLVSTNSEGLRSSASLDNSKDTFRIMTLGCSTTFGWGVSNEEAYPARLQHYLSQEVSNVEVINAGQPGYTSFQGLWLWDQILKGYKPDVVVIGYIVQDSRKAAYSDKSQAILQSDSRFLKDNFLYRSKIYLALRFALGKVQVKAKERSSQDEGGAFRVPPQDFADNLRGLVSKIKSVSAEPVLFGYPLERTGYTEAHRRILKAAAENLDTLHFDPQSKMEEAASSQELYFPNDKGHANAAGNDLIAQWMSEFLREQQKAGQ